MKTELYVLHTCDQWKSYDSFRLAGVFALENLKEELWARFLKNEIEYDGRGWSDYQEAIYEAETDGEKEDIHQAIEAKEDELYQEFCRLDARSLHNACTFISITACELNEVLD